MDAAFRIVDPCRGKAWADLPGDGRQRYCDRCGQFVHAIENYSTAEQRRLFSQSGNVCIALGVTAAKAPSRRAVFAVSLLAALRPVWAQTGSLRAVVSDRSSAVVSDATVTVYRDTALLAEARTDSRGEAIIANLPSSVDLEVRATASGFVTRRFPARTGTTAEAVLELGSVGGGAHVEPVAAPIKLPEPPPTPKKSWWRRLTG